MVHPPFWDNLVTEDDSFRFQDRLYHVVGSSNGLVWFLFWVKKCLIKTRNPSIRLQSTIFPTLTIMPPHNIVKFQARVHRGGFGYHASTDTYKLVVVFWDRTTEKWEGRVHCMGDTCWRPTFACPDFPTLLKDTLAGPFVNGSVNWLARHSLNCHLDGSENVPINQLVILSLDLQREACTYILLPDGFVEMAGNDPTLTVLRDFLCMCYDQMRTHFVVWQMREFGVQESWSQLVNVSYVHLQFGDFVPKWLLLPVCLSENGDVMLLASIEDSNYVTIYNRRDDSVERIVLPSKYI